MALLVVEERFSPAIDVNQVNPNADKLSPCLPTYGVTWVASYIANDGTRCICVYEAPDAAAVRRAYRTAGAPFEAVWPAKGMRA